MGTSSPPGPVDRRGTGRSGLDRAARLDPDREGHGQPVGDGELAEPVVVEVVVELQLGRAEPVALDDHAVGGAAAL